MKYYIGIEGGATKTYCIVTGNDFKIIYEGTGISSNLLINGQDRSALAVFELITNALNILKLSFNNIQAIFLGTAGAGRIKTAQSFQHFFIDFLKKHNIDYNNFFVESDARISLEGAFSGGPGAVLISGTGSIMLAKNRDDKIFRAGGYGRLIGDEGSGYSIGRKGVNLLSKSMDGRSPKTMLRKLFKEHFNITTRESLIDNIYGKNFDIASAAPVVIKAAEEGDTGSLEIIQDEIYELLLHISTLYKRIKEPVLNLSLTGTILTADNFFSRNFKEQVILQLPFINIKEPDYPPAVGAVIMAKKLAEKQ